jgi:hypothetical protein
MIAILARTKKGKKKTKKKKEPIRLCLSSAQIVCRPNLEHFLLIVVKGANLAMILEMLDLFGDFLSVLV